MDSNDNRILCQSCNEPKSNILLHLNRKPDCANAYSPIAKQRLIELCAARSKKKKELYNAALHKAKNEDVFQAS